MYCLGNVKKEGRKSFEPCDLNLRDGCFVTNPRVFFIISSFFDMFSGACFIPPATHSAIPHLAAADKTYLSSPLKGVLVHLRHPFSHLIKPYATCLTLLPPIMYSHLVLHCRRIHVFPWSYNLCRRSSVT